MQIDLDPTTLTPKALKAYQKVIQKKNEQFYVKKRSLFRKAEQVVKGCNSDVFIIVHNKDTDKMFSFTNDDRFNLEKISRLILRDVQQGAILQKNRKFVEEDFEKIKRNIDMMEQINKQYDPANDVMPQKLVERESNILLLGKKNLTQSTETDTLPEEFQNPTKKQKKPSRKEQLLQKLKIIDSQSVSSDQNTERIASDGFLSPRPGRTPLTYLQAEPQRYANTMKKKEGRQNRFDSNANEYTFGVNKNDNLNQQSTQNQLNMSPAKKSQMSGVKQKTPIQVLQHQVSQFDDKVVRYAQSDRRQPSYTPLQLVKYHSAQPSTFEQYNEKLAQQEQNDQNILSPRGDNYRNDFQQNQSLLQNQADFNMNQVPFQKRQSMPVQSQQYHDYPPMNLSQPNSQVQMNSNQYGDSQFNQWGNPQIDNNQIQRHKFDQVVEGPSLEQVVDCDDIFICNDRDEIRQNKSEEKANVRERHGISYLDVPKKPLQTPLKKVLPPLFNEDLKAKNQNIESCETPCSKTSQMDLASDILVTPKTEPNEFKRAIEVQGTKTYAYKVTTPVPSQKRDFNKNQQMSQFGANSQEQIPMNQYPENRYQQAYNSMNNDQVNQEIIQQYNYNININYDCGTDPRIQENHDDSYPIPINKNPHPINQQCQYSNIAPNAFDYQQMPPQRDSSLNGRSYY